MTVFSRENYPDAEVEEGGPGGNKKKQDKWKTEQFTACTDSPNSILNVNNETFKRRFQGIPDERGHHSKPQI